MGENSKIAWTDHTFNPWIGCQKVSAGCQNCYAARDNNRYHWVNEWGKDYHRTSEANWKKPIQWARQAVKDGVIRRVFCASLADVFDPNVPEEWHDDLWEIIFETKMYGGLEWLILTKRPEYISTIPSMLCGENSNIRMGVTAENQEMANKRIPELLNSWSGKNFVSYEPALELVDFSYYLNGCPERDKVSSFGSSIDYDWVPTTPPIQWLICGSESGTNARTFDIDWARSVRDQCLSTNTPFFLKQMPVDGKLTVLPELDGKVWNEFPRMG